MPFLAYFLVLVITVAGAALGLDALTAPPPELKQKIAAGSNSPKPRQIPIDRPQTQAADTSGQAATPVQPAAPAVADAQPATSPAAAPVVSSPATTADANPPSASTGESAVQATAVAQPPQPVAAAEAAPAPANTAAANASLAMTASAPAATCNVQLCAATYRSFRESDCTYQPFQGERRLCERTAQDAQDNLAATPRPREPRNEWTARSDNRRDAGLTRRDVERRDVEIRAVERRVRQLTDDELLDEEPMYARPGRRVIVVETPEDRGYYVAPESYSRRWQSPGWR